MVASISARQIATLVQDGSHDPVPGYQRLADAIRMATMDGRLQLGHRLPSERALATRLGISRTTVTAAYDRLREVGFAESRQGSGTFTATPAPAGTTGRQAAPGMWAPAARSPYLEWSHAAPNAPIPHLVQAYERALPRLAHHVGGHGYEAFGLPDLRAAIASTYTARGVATTPEQILVTPGAQAAHMIILATLSRPGQAVLAEHPSYPHALDAFARHRLALTTLDVHDGWDIAEWRRAARSERPQFAYLIPDFQNPTGQVMPEQARADLTAALLDTRVVIDEALTWMDLDAVSPLPMASVAPGAICVGSISKVGWGGIRCGWIRADPALISRFAGYRAAWDAGVPVLEQLVTIELLAELPALQEHRIRELRVGRDFLADLLRSELPAVRFRKPPGGLSLWVDVGGPVATQLAVALLRRDVRVTPGSRFAAPGWAGALERRVRLPYTLPAADLARGVTALKAALSDESVAHPTAEVGFA